MRCADVMVSDFSGIVFDYLFLFGKPVLSFKGQYDKRGKNAMDYSGEPWYISALDTIGETLEEGDIEALPEKIDAVIKNRKSFSNALKKLRSEMDRYPGESGKRGADAILDIARSLVDD